MTRLCESDDDDNTKSSATITAIAFAVVVVVVTGRRRFTVVGDVGAQDLVLGEDQQWKHRRDDGIERGVFG